MDEPMHPLPFVASLRIVSSPGPDRAPAGRPRVGLTGATCLQYSWDESASAELSAPLPTPPFTAAIGDLLEYDVFPELPSGATGEPEELADATAVAIDVIFEDGQTFSDLGGCDQRGVRCSAKAMRESATLQPDQWNRIIIDLSPAAGRSVRAVRLSAAPRHGSPGRGWIDGPRRVTAPSATQSTSVLDDVVTLRGTHSTAEISRGNTAPFVGVPNGFHLLSPVTNARDSSWMYTYHRDVDADAQPALEAVAISHAASPWLGDRGVLHVFPIEDAEADRPRRLRFDRAAEKASPASYEVSFESGEYLRMAATQHAAAIEIRVPRDNATVLLSFPSTHAAWDPWDGATSLIRGSSRQRGLLPDGASACHYSIQFRQPILSVQSVRSPDGNAISVTVASEPNERIDIRIGASMIDVAHAERHLRDELDDESPYACAETEARALWESALSGFRLEGATADQRTTFFSSLYRLFLYPSIAHESALSGDGVEHRVPGRDDRDDFTVAPGPLTVNNGFWDTYRTTWPAYALFRPESAARLLEGVLAHARDTGWIPRWTAPGAVDLMVGTSADIVIAEAICKGTPLIDRVAAFDVCVRDAVAPSDHPAVGRKGIRSGRFRGYISNDVHEGLSWTLENAISDDALSRAAEVLRDHPRTPDSRRVDLADLATYLRHRSRAYRHVLDHDTGFFRGRDRHGKISSHFDPRRWGGDYTETNAWGMAFTAPHDPDGLAALLGGRAALGARLDEYFSTPELASAADSGAYGQIIHEMTEARNVRSGMFGLSNQPAHHVPFMYAFSDRPSHGHAVVSDVLRRCFLGSEIGQGYPGDEDNGEMSAWYLFAAMGIYPLSPASGEYVLTPPLHPRIEIDLPRGTLVVTADRDSPEAAYIRSVSVDGVDWNDVTIDHSTLARGAHLHFTLTSDPTPWGLHTREVPSLIPSWSDLSAASSARWSRRQLRRLIDDEAASDVRLRADDWIAWDHGQPASLEMYTVTAGRDVGMAVSAWVLEGSSDGAHWVVLDEKLDVSFRWPEELVPVAVASMPFRFHRFRTRERGTLTQIELLSTAHSSRIDRP